MALVRRSVASSAAQPTRSPQPPITKFRRRNAYDADPTERKTGDPNDLIAGGGRWTIVMGVARVRGFVIASAGERIETETSVSTTGPVEWTHTTQYTKQELIDYVDANEISYGTVPNIWESNPYALRSPTGYKPGNDIEFGYVVEHPSGYYVVARAWDVGAPTTETVIETHHAKVLMGFAIPVTPNADLEVFGVVDPGTGLLVAEYVSDTPYAIEDFTLTAHAGKSDQTPPDILLEIGEPVAA